MISEPLGSFIKPASVRRAGPTSYPVLSMTMRGGLVDQSAKFKKRVASSDTSQYKIVNDGQLVVGFPIDEGVLSLQTQYREAIVSPAYEIWEIVDSRIRPEYLERYLKSVRAITYYKAKLRGTTARRRTIPREDFLTMPVFVPSLAKQQEVIEILDRASTLLIRRNTALAILDELSQSIYLDMFGDPASNPNGWPVVKIADILESASYGTSSKSGPTGSLPILRMNNVTASGQIDLTDLKYIDLSTEISDRYTIRPGDVLFNRTNSPSLVGKSAIYRHTEPMVYAGYLIRLRTNKKADPEYLAGFLNTRYAKNVLRMMCKTIIGMANINSKELQTIPILCPPVEIQRAFGHRMQAVDRLKTGHVSHIASVNALLRSLEDRAFRGEL